VRWGNLEDEFSSNTTLFLFLCTASLFDARWFIMLWCSFYGNVNLYSQVDLHRAICKMLSAGTRAWKHGTICTLHHQLIWFCQGHCLKMCNRALNSLSQFIACCLYTFFKDSLFYTLFLFIVFLEMAFLWFLCSTLEVIFLTDGTLNIDCLILYSICLLHPK